MGRYYNTDTGREGKFMFAVQSSTDPEYMGMHENTNILHYWASEDDQKEIIKKLDEQYDILSVKKSDRIYHKVKMSVKDYDKWEDKVLLPKVFIDVKTSNEKAMAKYDQTAKWSSEKGSEYVSFERDKGFALALARIRLGLDILTDIEETGWCDMRAEVI